MKSCCLLYAQGLHSRAQAAAADVEERQGVLVPDVEFQHRADNDDAAAGRLGRHVRQRDQLRCAVGRLADAVVRGPRHAQAAPQRAGVEPLCPVLLGYWAWGPVVHKSCGLATSHVNASVQLFTCYIHSVVWRPNTLMPCSLPTSAAMRNNDLKPSLRPRSLSWVARNACCAMPTPAAVHGP